ncbi:DUF2057 domain-containing protein [Moraxella haemolytica]|uniref:DUF2057 family protein n=1 Tax=Moraxella TaxID=475 RepID=UPI002543BC04|nr:DUF2057 family protein [Moraxella sp. ZY171148]WII94621.1 DUF2057 domain-containing protein [Moraxella sp. ZY171148]
MKILTAGIITALLASSAYAEVHLLVDDNIKVTAINGQEIHHSVLQPLKREFTLQAGRHVITARYDRLFDLTRGDHDYLKSGNISVVGNLQDKQSYQLIMPNQPNNYTAAKEFIKSPTLAIVQNGQVLSQESIAEERTGILSSITQSIGGIFGRGNSAIISNQKAISALETPTTQHSSNKENLDSFMQLWLNSSEEEREKIRQWIGK